MTLDPGNIGRTRQAVVDDVCTVWKTIDHGRVRLGYWYTGIANSLDGTEDSFITRDAKQVWDSMGMALKREEAIAEVRQRVKDGLTWDQVRTILVVHLC